MVKGGNRYVKSNHCNVDFDSLIVKVQDYVFFNIFLCVLISAYCCIAKDNGYTLFKNIVIIQKKIHHN